ncbi:hypothetical protein ACWCPS_37330 [Streptomyces mauvecolor]
MWGTIAAVAVGTIFGAGSTLLTDRLRSREDLMRQWGETRKLVYVRFVVALSRAHGRMLKVTFRGLNDSELEAAVHDAYHDDPEQATPKASMRELAIVAPDHVYEAARSTYDSLQVLRNFLAHSATLTRDSSEYKELNAEYRGRLRALELVMRDDLKPALPPRRRRRAVGAGTDA